jgi:nitroreductase
MRAQRAIRRLKPDPVDDKLVLQLIELALKAPSGSNQQNWEFVVVKDRAVKARLAWLTRISWRFYGGLGRQAARNSPKALRMTKSDLAR